MQEDTTSEIVTDSGMSEDQETASEELQDAISLSELNQLLGKNFPSKDAALKSIKDTTRYVGKVGQLEKQLAQVGTNLTQETAMPDNEVLSKVRQLEAQVEETNFFAEHPEFKEYKDSLRSMREMTGKPLTELATSEAFKPFLEKARAHDEQQKKRSVLESTPRLGQVRDKIKEAKEMADKGNFPAAEEAAVNAVVESFI